MHSIYKGTLSHRRIKPKKHQFKYDVSMLFIDLSEINNAFSKLFFWSLNRPNLASFYRNDYYGPDNEPLEYSIKKLVEKNLSIKLSGKIFLLTTIRLFGYCFNPVSFYYCYNSKNKLTAIVSHITNTPWNERHAYVHDCRNKKIHSKGIEFNKQFHVSPFMPMDIRYNWIFTEPKDFLYVSMDNFKKNELMFNATLKLKKRAWNSWELNKILFLTLPMSFKAIFLIYWNAFMLFIKRVTFYPHP